MALRRRTAPSYLETHQIHQLRLSSNSLSVNEGSNECSHHDSLTLHPTPTNSTKASRKQSALLSGIQFIAMILLCALPWSPSVILDRRVQAAQKEADEFQTVQKQNTKGITSALDRRRQLNERVLELETENNKLLNILKLHGDLIDPGNNIYKKAEKDEEILLQRISGIESTIQTLDRQALQQKYRQGHMTFEFRFGQVQDSRLSKKVLVGTIFPMEMIPHSLRTVLDMTQKIQLQGPTLSHEKGACLELASDIEPDRSQAKSLLFAESSEVESMQAMKGKWEGQVSKKDFSQLFTHLIVCLCVEKQRYSFCWCQTIQINYYVLSRRCGPNRQWIGNGKCLRKDCFRR